jgi:DNA-binding NarL/FixJ family response regulator
MLTAIVVMDIVMPKMDGIAATRLIKTTYPHFAIIGLTGDLKNYTLYSMKKAGAYEVVDKKNAVVKCMTRYKGQQASTGRSLTGQLGSGVGSMTDSL